MPAPEHGGAATGARAAPETNGPTLLCCKQTHYIQDSWFHTVHIGRTATTIGGEKKQESVTLDYIGVMKQVGKNHLSTVTFITAFHENGMEPGSWY